MGQKTIPRICLILAEDPNVWHRPLRRTIFTRFRTGPHRWSSKAQSVLPRHGVDLLRFVFLLRFHLSINAPLPPST